MKKRAFLCSMVVGLMVSAIFTSRSMAAEFHVTTASGFQAALDIAGTNGEDDIVTLGPGIYEGNFVYGPGFAEHKSLMIVGEPGTGPMDIILDGQNSGRVLYILDNFDGPLAEIKIIGITAKNGNSPIAGGGIDILATWYNLYVLNCIITDNTAAALGGGLYIDTNQDLYLQNNLIMNNTVTESGTTPYAGDSRGGGAMLFARGGTYTIQNNIIANNSALGTVDPAGGGLYIGYTIGDTIDAIGNTIVNNQAGRGGGVLVNPVSTVNLCNNIVYGNAAIQGEDIWLHANTPTRTGYNNNYSDIYGSWTDSENNLNMDPLFVSPKNNDYHLRPNSPMVNAGKSDVPSPPGLPVTDFEGDPRSYGEAPDMGADEFAGDKYYPQEGTFGSQIALLRSGFGIKKGKVLLGSSALKVLEWTEETIRCQLAKAISPGAYDVTIQPKGLDQIVIENGFTVKAPEIRSINSNSGSAGEEIRIHGFFFGTKKGKVTLGGKTCKVRSWIMDPTSGQSEIRFVVPKAFSLGTQELKVINKIGEDTESFTVN